MNFDTLAARALNASRNVHKPTYVGLRLLLKAASQNQAAFLAFMQRRCQTREAWRYFSFQALKEAGRDKHPVYRNCIIGSPLTTAVEAHVLTQMAQQEVFSPLPCAYSYLWPRQELLGRNFEYFFDGYERRNQRIEKLLAEDDKRVAIVTDIKAFYPSVDREKLKRKVDERLSRIADAESARSIGQFVNALLDLHAPKTTGIPIGPDISHVLGHIALDAVDAAMMAAYSDRYFRYVDDIVVICPKTETERAMKLLSKVIADEGLKLHDGKNDEVSGAVWQSDRRLVVGGESASTSFTELLDDVTLFLLRNPHAMESLQRNFRSEGFSLPITRLQSLTRSRRYRAHLRRRIWQRRGIWTWWLTSWFTNEESLFAKARAVREDMLHLAEQLHEAELPSQSMRRRWYVQKRRFVFNRLLYLLSPKDYPLLLQLIPDIDEFTETRLVAGALATGDGTALLRYPGRVIDSFCQLWGEHHEGEPAIVWPKEVDRAEAESAAHLALFQNVFPPPECLDGLGRKAPGSRILVELCSGNGTDPTPIERMSYLDEMEMLFRAVPRYEIRNLVTSRFDELEDVGLEGLLLGGSGYDLPWDVGEYVR